ncbi:hypothetical protein BN3590_04014 [Clostridium sp. C105KSO15]|nr:hypothetical protein BN3590_04014 [Clostridium sp. C105KSO15]
MGPIQLSELRQKYIKNPPEGITAKPVKGMTASDLLNMYYFLVDEEEEFEEVYIS